MENKFRVSKRYQEKFPEKENGGNDQKDRLENKKAVLFLIFEMKKH